MAKRGSPEARAHQPVLPGIGGWSVVANYYNYDCNEVILVRKGPEGELCKEVRQLKSLPYKLEPRKRS